MKIKLVASGLALLLSGGCGGAGIDVMRYDGTPATMNGVPWNLAMTSFKVTITRRVTGCGAQLTGTVEAAVEAADPRVDPAQMYTLHSDGWWNKSAIRGTYGANGVSTGLNASSEGQAGIILTHIVSSIASVAPTLAARSREEDACRPEVVAALAVLGEQPDGPDGTPTPTLANLIKAQTRELAALTNTVRNLSAQAAALGAAATDEDRRAFRDAIKAMTDKTEELAANQMKLDAALKVVTHISTETWPNIGTDFTTGTPFRLDQTFFETKWANVERPGPSAADFDVASFDVFLDLRLKDPTTPGAGDQSRIDPRVGVPVRFAQTGVVRVCAPLSCDAEGSEVIKAFEAPVLQLGRVVMIPVSGGAWRSTTAAVALDGGGNPTTIEAANTVSLGEAVGAFADSTAATLAGLPAAIDAAELARTQARTNQQLAENALLTARAQGATAGELAPLQAETALANARIAQLAAQAALSTAQNSSMP